MSDPNHPNALTGSRRAVRQGVADSQHLARLAQLRVGKPAGAVRLVQHSPGRVDVFSAPAGRFASTRDGRWVYVDELGRRWDIRRHDRVAYSHGRLPYGHVVLRDRQAPEAARIVAYARPPLQKARVDDRRRRRER